jgi:hypothetical protein
MTVLQFFIKNFGCIFPLVPAVIGISTYKLQDKSGKLITVLSILGFIIYLISAFGTIKGNNMRSLHLWTVLEFAIISVFYFYLFKNKKLKYLIFSLSISFLIFSIINSLYIQGIYTYNSYARGLEASLLTLFSLVYLIYIINNESFFSKKLRPTLYFVIAILIYFGFAQVLYLSYHYLSDYSPSFVSYSFDSVKFINLIFNLLLSIGLWKRKLISI